MDQAILRHHVGMMRDDWGCEELKLGESKPCWLCRVSSLKISALAPALRSCGKWKQRGSDGQRSTRRGTCRSTSAMDAELRRTSHGRRLGPLGRGPGVRRSGLRPSSVWHPLNQCQISTERSSICLWPSSTPVKNGPSSSCRASIPCSCQWLVGKSAALAHVIRYGVGGDGIRQLFHHDSAASFAVSLSTSVNM